MDNMETLVVKPSLNFSEDNIELLVLSKEQSELLDSKINDIRNFIKGNSGRGESDEVKDKLYKDAQLLWGEFSKSINSTKYTLFLNREQYKFLNNLLQSKLEYDVNTVFFVIELSELMMRMNMTKIANDAYHGFDVTATEITYMYHLISQYKVKGLTKETYLFTDILKRIGHISKIFNYYDNESKTLSSDIMDWVSSFDEGVIASI
jgi:hypothetical protein